MFIRVRFVLRPSNKYVTMWPGALAHARSADTTSADAFHRQLEDLERAFDRGLARPASASRMTGAPTDAFEQRLEELERALDLDSAPPASAAEVTAAPPKPSVSHQDKFLTQIERRVAAFGERPIRTEEPPPSALSGPYVPVDVEYRLFLAANRGQKSGGQPQRVAIARPLSMSRRSFWRTSRPATSIRARA